MKYRILKADEVLKEELIKSRYKQFWTIICVFNTENITIDGHFESSVHKNTFVR